MTLQAFPQEGRFYKGALHVHTTNSDGWFSPEEVAEAYAQKGFDFMAFTDHNHFTWLGAAYAGMTMLAGVEYNTKKADHPTMHHHVVAIYPPGMEKILRNPLALFNEVTGREEAQRMIDAVKAQGALAIYAHPSWSFCDPRELIALRNYDMIEVYNHLSELDQGHGHNESFCDMLLWLGKRFFLAATDDTHQKGPMANEEVRPDTAYDIGGGFVVVKALDQSPESLFAALSSGSFYCSEGPSIEEFTIADGHAHLRCSPARSIYVKGYPDQGTSLHGENLTEGSLRLPLPTEEYQYVRALVVDEQGYKAWSNPLYVK